ncbi:MAG: polysaccharide biosynthesis/export family protein [Bacteroidia bacterium]|nr:polysaccharide biosynthesis/export family protein [Bacteroidia bacterium]
MKVSFKPIFFFILALQLMSCGKKLIYFQESEKSKNKYNNISIAKPEEVREHIIEAGDIIGLKIISTNKELNEEFSKYSTSSSDKGENAVSGILVQENGTIFLPYIGSIKVTGTSIVEAEKNILEELNKTIVNITIELRLNSFRVTVLGDIRSPGIKNSPGDRLTIIDALSLSGDLGDDANRKNIKVIRQKGDKKITYLLDISSIDIFNSEAYYLKSNDIVYVESLQRRFLKENLTYVSLLLTLVNTIAILIRI